MPTDKAIEVFERAWRDEAAIGRGLWRSALQQYGVADDEIEKVLRLLDWISDTRMTETLQIMREANRQDRHWARHSATVH